MQIKKVKGEKSNQGFSGLLSFISKEYDSILLFVGIFLLFYLGMNLVRSQILMKNLLEPEYLWQKAYLVHGNWSEESLDGVAELFRDQGDNCVIRSVYGGVGYTNDFQELQLYLSAEAFAKKKKIDVEGWEKAANSVMIEGRLKPRTYLRDGTRWIIISGMEFQVYDIVEKDEILAQSVYLNWNNLDKPHKKKYMERIEYANQDRDSAVIQLQSLTQFHDEVESFETKNNNDLRELKRFMDFQKINRQDIFEKMKKFYLFMELAGVFSVYYLTELWFARRKREFLIRRMLGSGLFQIWVSAVKESGTVTGFAFATATLLELLELGLHIAGKLETKEVLYTMVMALLITLVIEFILFGIRIASLIRVYPTQNNIESAN